MRAAGIRPHPRRGAIPGLHAKLTFDPGEDIAAPFVGRGARPRIAILREQGVNGQIEMAAAFDRAGFAAVDVHMSDIIAGRASLEDFKGFAACGGFSYGDVLGAGEGWAKSILFNARAREEFEAFFGRADTFALGVCNGCQMMSNLRELIPGRGRVAAFRAQPVGAVRGALRDGGGAALAVAVLRGHGGQPHADRGRPRRRLCRVRGRRRAEGRGGAGGAALRRQPRAP